MSLTEILALAVAAIGVFFTLLSSIGLLRMPDLYTRVHTSGKASTLGVAGVLVAVAIQQADLFTGAKMVALVAFFLITAPAAAHMLDRAAYITGVPTAQGTAPDDLRGRYDSETRRLR